MLNSLYNMLNHMGTLYIVATPIGNLQDISQRAIDVLKKVDVIACEDTRITVKLLTLLNVQTNAQLVSYYEQNEHVRTPQIINALKNDLSVALVSDAGTPLISDPGFKLIRELRKENISVESIPGASSVLTALTLSGLPTDKFLFVGYPPQKRGHRQTFFKKIKKANESISSTIIVFESPHKLLTTLLDMQGVYGDIPVVLCRELTKLHQQVKSERISSFLKHFQYAAPKGEFVIVFNLSTRNFLL